MNRRRQAGVAALEMALVLVPLVLITFATTELGRALYQYNRAVTATRDAARYLSTQGVREGENVARCLAVFGEARTACDTGTPLVPGLAPGMVKFTYATSNAGPAGPINLVTVSIEGLTFSSAVPFAVTDFRMSPVHTTMRQGGA